MASQSRVRQALADRLCCSLPAMDLEIAWGAAALAVPEAVTKIAMATDAAMDAYLSQAAELALEELEALREAEREAGHRLHKGHALHNHGAAIIAADSATARRFFYAAYVEDIRTFPDDPEQGWPSRRTIQSLWGDTDAALGRLADLGRDNTEDPLVVAERYETTEEGLPPFRGGAMWGVRKVKVLDHLDPSQLVFVGGGYASPEGIVALRLAVADVDLIPVVVAEFEDFDKAYPKSETLMGRCSLGLIDVSRSEAGWREEIDIAERLGVPLFVGHIAWSSGEPPHLNDMAAGNLERLALKSVATVSAAQLRIEAAKWLRAHVALRPVTLGTIYVKPDLGPSAMGTATRDFAIGSNMRDMGKPQFPAVNPDAPQAVPSGGWGPIEPRYDPDLAGDYKLVDGKIGRSSPRSPTTRRSSGASRRAARSRLTSRRGNSRCTSLQAAE
jgi:hypothetical protein